MYSCINIYANLYNPSISCWPWRIWSYNNERCGARPRLSPVLRADQFDVGVDQKICQSFGVSQIHPRLTIRAEIQKSMFFFPGSLSLKPRCLGRKRAWASHYHPKHHQTHSPDRSTVWRVVQSNQNESIRDHWYQRRKMTNNHAFQCISHKEPLLLIKDLVMIGKSWYKQSLATPNCWHLHVPSPHWSNETVLNLKSSTPGNGVHTKVSWIIHNLTISFDLEYQLFFGLAVLIIGSLSHILQVNKDYQHGSTWYM